MLNERELWKDLSYEQKSALIRYLDRIITTDSVQDVVNGFITELPKIFYVNAYGFQFLNPWKRDICSLNTLVGVSIELDERARALRYTDPAWKKMLLTKQTVTNRSIFRDDAWECQSYYKQILSPFGLFHFIMSPIVINGNIRGFINIIREKKYPFSELEISCFKQLSFYITKSIKSIDSFHKEFSRNYIRKLELYCQNRNIDKITSREKEVISLVAEGLSDREIAECLNISIYTVKDHLKNIYSKLKVTSRVQAVSKVISQYA